jgi:hypothetical protein
MKTRILTGWNFRRGLYTVVGVFLVVISIIDQQWPGVVFGGYFASMGILGFGCAGGNCAVPTKPVSKADLENIVFEEIKTK